LKKNVLFNRSVVGLIRSHMAKNFAECKCAALLLTSKCLHA
jgi:hypothetical protein